ncbi:MAG: YdcF family protein [Stappiaceae bacterium]
MTPLCPQENQPPSPALVRAINRYLLIKTELVPAELCLVFGGQRSAEARVKEAVRLWQEGMFKHIIVSGGRAEQAGRTEAEMMADELVRAGVSRSQITIETKSKNTGENVEFSMRVLRELGLFDSISSVIAVGRLSASRRYLMTIERHWPDVVKMLAPANYHPVDPTQWQTSPALTREVLSEWQNLRPYLKAGFIRELNTATCPLLQEDAH